LTCVTALTFIFEQFVYPKSWKHLPENLVATTFWG